MTSGSSTSRSRVNLPVLGIVAGSWGIGLATALWAKPPEGALSSTAQGPEMWLAGESALYVTIAAIVVAMLMTRYAGRQHLTRWLIATVIAAAAAVWCATDYFGKIQDWRCMYADGWKIVGDPSSLTSDSKNAMAELKEVDPCRYLWLATGEVETVWGSESVLPRRASVRRLYLLIAPLFTCLLLSAAQTGMLARPRREVDPLMSPALVAARVHLRVFISYRRDDSEDAVDALHAYLTAYYGERVFLDKKSISAGSNFVATIRAAVASSDVMLVVVGPRWLAAADEHGHRRRLDDPDDLVRREIAQALAMPKIVIPLLRSTTMPQARDLPEELAPFALCNARPLRAFPDQAHDLRRILDRLDELALQKSRVTAQSATG